MGSKKTGGGVENVYAAAQKWVDSALRSDDSLFTPGTPIWTSKWLGELRERFLDRPDAGRGNFYEKLQVQLEDSPSNVYQLMGEVLYFHSLILWHETMKGNTKADRINRVLGWSTQPVTIPDDLVTGLTPGIANIGQARSRILPFMVGFVIEFVEQWKEQKSSERNSLLKDPWAFKGFATQIELQGRLFREGPNSHRPQREALLHLVFPNTFEGIVSIPHKRSIASARAFATYVNEPADDVDRKIQQIRSGLEGELGGDFDFYRPDIRSRWDPSSNPWDEFVRHAQEYVDTGQLESQEIDYKIEIGQQLGAAREAVLSDEGGWASHLESALPNGNPLDFRAKSRFCEWVDTSPDESLRALQAIWTLDDASDAERIRAFCDGIPRPAMSRPGTLTTLVSVLLMGLGVEKYPPYRTTTFREAYERTGYEQLDRDADEAALYEHALGFLDHFIEEARHRGLKLRHRLDAQSIVYIITSGPPPPPPPCHDGLDTLADELTLPVEFLEDVETLLDDKRQVIFQGPPGTGKTYVAQKLARHLAGSEDRVTLVQFHPSYAYEDFVQGFRPKITDDGQPGFELRDGPLRKAADRARQEPQAKHFLVIDEINRGNLARVFGELYFLLEYRDSEMDLQYSDEPFSLPDNLYIIGTMNTADRSIALVDLALRRRFYFVEFHPDEELVKGVLRNWLRANASGMEWVADVVDTANEKLSNDRHAAIGPSYFMKPALDETAVKRIWKHSVLPYIEERLFGEPDRLAEFDLKALGGPGDDDEEDASGSE